MKRVLSLVLISSVFLTGCAASVNPQEPVMASDSAIAGGGGNVVDLKNVDYFDAEAEDMNFASMSDPELLPFIENAVYYQLIDELGEDTYIENVNAVYVSQEYIDELTYNSKSNIFFGYTLEELDAQFQGEKYVFTVENGQTVVQPMSEYDDTYDQIIRNVAVGTGVILICVTVSVVTGGTAPAVSMIFACAAESGAIMGLSSGVITGAAAGLYTGVTTGDWDQALKDGALAGSEGFMYGAISGSILGGAGEAIGLHGATLNGLTMDEAAMIQKESKLPLNLIGEFQSYEQYEIIKDSGMYGGLVNGQQALLRPIDLDYVDPETGLTNLQRMQQGLAALDPATGLPYELHHLGQTQDAVLAILTQEEHRGAGNFGAWHDLISSSVVNHGAEWTAQREAFWQSLAVILSAA